MITNKGDKFMSDKKNEAKETVKKEVLTFDCDIMPTGKISLDRKKLVDYITTEQRSYANFPCTMTDEDGDLENSFVIPELEAKFGQGLKLGIVVHLPDNAKGSKKSKTKRAL